MKRMSIESLIRIPLEIPQETSVHSKREEAKVVSINKSAEKNDVTGKIEEQKKPEAKNYSKGYIKYPTYDFF
jgi:hypothetical protein